MKSTVYTFLFVVLLVCISCTNNDQPVFETYVSNEITIPKGFVLEELYTPKEHDQGSWVAMAKDDKGNLYTSDQFGYIYYVTLPNSSNELKEIDVKKLNVEMGLAQGLLWHKNTLYALVNSNMREIKIHSGFYKITDSTGDGNLNKVDTLQVFKGWFGEHGPHNILLSPDEKDLYLVLGNRIEIPEEIQSYAPRIWDEDNIIPSIKDPSGHVNEIKAPGGWVAKVNIETEEWLVHNVGMRNTYDIAFNQDGELFGFDSDMELDLGMPWYRPIRLCHFTSGSEFGWRSGSGKFLPEYPDNLPGIANLGQGSPTGLIHGEGLKFPSYYQKGLFLFDWSYGTMYYASLTPKGSSYDVEMTQFLSGIPLPLTKGIVGDDGAMYFLTGGRRLASKLYRLKYEGDSPNEVVQLVAHTKGKKERNLRKELETFHTNKDASNIDFILSNIAHEDRFIRFAARTALEHQEYDLWKNKINKSTVDDVIVALSIAIARSGNDSDRANALNKLVAIEWASFEESKKIDFVRAVELLLIRSENTLNASLKNRLVKTLLPMYLKSSSIVNKELCKTLSFLQVSEIIETTLTAMESGKEDESQKSLYLSSDISQRSEQYGKQVEEMLKNMPNAQHVSYAKSLSVITEGWTKELRTRYFEWYNKALKKSGGNSYAQFIRAIQETALANVPLEDRQFFEALASEALTDVNNFAKGAKQPEGPGQNWTVATVKEAYSKNRQHANFENGRDYYKASLCANCHSMNGVGRNIGPDLSKVGTRFSIEDLAEAVVDPSSTISDRYRYDTYYMEDGRVVTGKVIEEEKSFLQISTNAFAPDLKTRIHKGRIESKEISDISPMPPGLFNRLNEQELTDLLTFLVSGGDKNNKVYN
jgi:putative heme-binding domain-containing protein